MSRRNVFYIFTIFVLAIGGIFADGYGMKILSILMYGGIIGIMVYATIHILRTDEWQ